MWLLTPRGMVSLCGSCRNKNANKACVSWQLWCRLPRLVEWCSSYSGRWWSLQQGLLKWLFHRLQILCGCFREKLWILLHLQTSPPTCLSLTLLWYTLNMKQIYLAYKEELLNRSVGTCARHEISSKWFSSFFITYFFLFCFCFFLFNPSLAVIVNHGYF